MVAVIVTCENNYLYTGLREVLLQKYSPEQIHRAETLNCHISSRKCIYIYCIENEVVPVDLISVIRKREHMHYTHHQILMTKCMFNVYRNLEYSFSKLSVIHHRDSPEKIKDTLFKLSRRHICSKRFGYGNALGVTKMQYKVMAHLVRGDSQESIAEKLQLSPKTVSTHKYKMLDQLNIRSNGEYFRYLQLCKAVIE